MTARRRLWPGSRVLLRRGRAALAVAALLLTAFPPAPAPAARSASAAAGLCDSAAAEAAARRGVPLPVLRALTLTETGRRLDGAARPWPWTVNMEGEGRWFDGRSAALDYVRDRHARGARSFDVGCFQINYRWHGDAFASIEAMFDPAANADYAARFLRDLYEETGSWSRAAGAYHSRTPDFAKRYRARFDRILAGLGDASEAAPPPAEAVVVAEARPGDDGAAAPDRSVPGLLPAARGPLIQLVALPAGAPGSVFASIAPPAHARAGGGPGLLRAARPLFD